MRETEKHLIVGLGNSGEKYKNTRHNVGFKAIDFFANHHGLVFRESVQICGSLAQGCIQKKQVILLKPMTFMNVSGESIKSCMQCFSIAKEKVLVVCDDITIALGKMRMRMKGSSGGHNGLKSVSLSLVTEEFARLRVGVDFPQLEEDLSDYVLGKFTKEQQKILEKLLPFTTLVLREWIVKGIAPSMQLAHSYPDCKNR
ncbi:aminoacyl-tRNA hydrolase [Candidatus Rhabdochlamydia oedothoracis]|uniref:aminoacyl-tRNA hydrolase n=1 Tax=Candidatus Rhabdochlamydia oedothoracis TaxID=2720720 RepID=UPI001C6517DF|nr:aminoacyl-tRNA hydrolase [Candidatus Rhabdochlamydia oedothoracis]KAG6559080.1 Peptidyl-tRNA hydrolase [Candidatus Rhabdochlamydia sp. W815]MCL6756197.1 aminoacyl-tRNA hydrolase [Candidatus Rhabdochlamydia oedothoracis]